MYAAAFPRRCNPATLPSLSFHRRDATRRDATPFARRHHANGCVSFIRAEQSSARNATIATAVRIYVRTYVGEIRGRRIKNIEKEGHRIGHDARSDAVINNSATRCRREFSGVDSTEKKIATLRAEKSDGGKWQSEKMGRCIQHKASDRGKKNNEDRRARFRGMILKNHNLFLIALSRFQKKNGHLLAYIFLSIIKASIYFSVRCMVKRVGCVYN